MFISDITEAQSVAGFFAGQAMEIVFKFLGGSIRNTVGAFVWPVWFVQYQPPWGMAILAGMYVVFAKFIKKPLEDWLFHAETSDPIDKK